MDYYKVVKVKNAQERVSVVVNPLYTDFYRVYRKDGKNLKVKNGMAFDNLQAAINFMKEESKYITLEIWTCSGRKVPLPRMLFSLSHEPTWPNEALKFLKKVLFHGGRYQDGNGVGPAWYGVPPGTVRLRDLKLKEKVS